MVAAHPGDLQAAKKVGFRPAFVARPLAHGPDGTVAAVSPADVDIIATDFLDLAAEVGRVSSPRLGTLGYRRRR